MDYDMAFKITISVAIILFIIFLSNLLYYQFHYKQTNVIIGITSLIICVIGMFLINYNPIKKLTSKQSKI